MIPESFKEGVRCLILLHRKKDGGDHKPAFYDISRSPGEWNHCFEKLMDMKSNFKGYENHRIYSSVNPRNFKKGVYHWEQRKLEAAHNGTLDHFLLNSWNMLFSCLSKPPCKQGSLFLLDCDTPEQEQRTREFLTGPFTIPAQYMLKIVHEYRTTNGYHFITEPFNPALLTGEDVPTIHKDGLLYVC